MIYEQPNVQYRCGKCGFFVLTYFTVETEESFAYLKAGCGNKECKEFGIDHFIVLEPAISYTEEELKEWFDVPSNNNPKES